MQAAKLRLRAVVQAGEAKFRARRDLSDEAFAKVEEIKHRHEIACAALNTRQNSYTTTADETAPRAQISQQHSR